MIDIGNIWITDLVTHMSKSLWGIGGQFLFPVEGDRHLMEIWHAMNPAWDDQGSVGGLNILRVRLQWPNGEFDASFHAERVRAMDASGPYAASALRFRDGNSQSAYHKFREATHGRA